MTSVDQISRIPQENLKEGSRSALVRTLRAIWANRQTPLGIYVNIFAVADGHAIGRSGGKLAPRFRALTDDDGTPLVLLVAVGQGGDVRIFTRTP